MSTYEKVIWNGLLLLLLWLDNKKSDIGHVTFSYDRTDVNYVLLICTPKCMSPKNSEFSPSTCCLSYGYKIALTRTNSFESWGKVNINQMCFILVLEVQTYHDDRMIRFAK